MNSLFHLYVLYLLCTIAIVWTNGILYNQIAHSLQSIYPFSEKKCTGMGEKMLGEWVHHRQTDVLQVVYIYVCVSTHLKLNSVGLLFSQTVCTVLCFLSCPLQ